MPHTGRKCLNANFIYCATYLFRFFLGRSTLTNYCKHFPKSICREFISPVGYLNFFILDVIFDRIHWSQYGAHFMFHNNLYPGGTSTEMTCAIKHWWAMVAYPSRSRFLYILHSSLYSKCHILSIQYKSIDPVEAPTGECGFL